MHQHTYEPYEEVNLSSINHEKLASTLEDQGYLFLRGAISQKKINRARSDIRQVLIDCGYVVDDGAPDLTWSGKGHESDDLAPAGHVGRKLGDLQSVADVFQAPELHRILRQLFDGQVFSWVENHDRVRVVLNNNARVAKRVGGQHITTATPSHQDFYHFRVPFVTAWIPLMDIDLATGGLTLRKGSHKNGLYEHWWSDSSYLGVANDTAEAKTFAESGGVVVAGEAKPNDDNKIWLRSDYEIGDVLIFHPKMVHRGLANMSGQIRVSADFRFQRQGSPTVWQARHRLYECHKFLNEARCCLNEMEIDTSVADRAWEQMRFHGPRSDQAVGTQAKAMVDDVMAGSAPG